MKWAVEEKAREAVGNLPAETIPTATPLAAAPPALPGYLDLESRRNAVEKETIERALAAAKGNKSLAARLLKISRNGLAARMRALRVGSGETI